MNHQGTKQLETERLLLRPFTLEDAESMFRNWAGDPEVTRYLTWPTHTSVKDSGGFISYCVSHYADPSFYNWGIMLKSTGELIGNIGVVHSDDAVRWAELGWVLGRAWWGRGIMPEAARRVLDLLFDEAGFERVTAKHDTENPKSGRVMQKIGMTYEGTLRRSHLNNRGIVDVAVYSLLLSEQK